MPVQTIQHHIRKIASSRLSFCSCGYFVISNRAYSYECEHSTYMSDSHDSE